jgi:hypothetical protein
MTAWYVHRGDDGAISSAHESPQEGYAEEAIDSDAVELAAFLDRALNPVPATASAGDFMRALYELGWYDDVVAAVEAGGELGKILWARASLFERNHPLVTQIATAINKTADDLDALFRKAASYG